LTKLYLLWFSSLMTLHVGAVPVSSFTTGYKCSLLNSVKLKTAGRVATLLCAAGSVCLHIGEGYWFTLAACCMETGVGRCAVELGTSTGAAVHLQLVLMYHTMAMSKQRRVAATSTDALCSCLCMQDDVEKNSFNIYRGRPLFCAGIAVLLLPLCHAALQGCLSALPPHACQAATTAAVLCACSL
jgi:hypothetical protein